MPPDKICKTVHQYNKEPISEEHMRKLQEIAEDYKKVKNYVYTRFGGIGSLSKLYPGYTVQNEMTKSGLRGDLGLPSVYFYLAVFDALGDIKSQWTRTKTKVLELIGKNERFSAEQKHYLRFLIKVSNAFEAVVNQEPLRLPEEIQQVHDELAAQVDRESLHRYLRRQVRKFHVKQHTETAEGFFVSEKAYRYQNHGIYISIKEKRKRIFIPLTDNNQYKRQLYIKLYPEQGNIEIKVPVDVAVKSHKDYTGQTGVSVGIQTMLTTDEGHCYGKELGQYQIEYADWMRIQTGIYNRNRSGNPGRKKYGAKKRRLTERMHSYINQELNRFLKSEKPQTIYIAKLPRPQAGGVSRKINNSVAMWQRGYIRKRLIQKCREQSVELVEVFGKDISNECSRCGAFGSRHDGRFFCGACGYDAEDKTNAARNAKKRGMEGGM
ncbi:MAG: transposase [Lachnospiraceae bacterium]